MPDLLRLTLNRDSDGTGELVAEVSADGFSGVGSAWFNLSELLAFGQLLATTYPLLPGQVYELKGGVWSSVNHNTLDFACLWLRFYPVGLHGMVGCQISLATPPNEQGCTQRQHTVTVELRTYYEQLRTFGLAFAGLVSGDLNEITL